MKAKLVEDFTHLKPKSDEELQKNLVSSSGVEINKLLYRMMSNSRLFKPSVVLINSSVLTRRKKFQSFIEYVMGIDWEDRIKKSGKYFQIYDRNELGIIRSLDREEKIKLYKLLTEPNERADDWLKRMNDHELREQ